MRSIALACALGCLTLHAAAEVIRFEVLESVPAFEGRSFGRAAAGSLAQLTP